MINIEIQYFTGCPNSQKLIDAVKEAIKDFKSEINYTETLVETIEKADKLKFRGSPTLLINGVDFENLPEPQTGNYACRVYSFGFPTITEILNKLNAQGQNVKS